MSDSLRRSLTQHDIESSTRALEALRRQYAARHRGVVFDITAEHDGAREIVLRGRVLVMSQLCAAEAAVFRAIGARPRSEVVVLAEHEAAAGWAATSGPVLDVLDGPEGALTTQVTDTDGPVRVLLTRAEWCVVQLADDTVGWARAAELDQAAAGQVPLDVAGWRSAFRGRPVSASDEEWRAAAREWIGTKYTLGGTTPAGVDCSGLAQRLYKAVLGVGVPRHSHSQLRAGSRVGLTEVAAGDLLVLTHAATGTFHVAVALGGRPARAVHACRERGAVIEETNRSLLERYRFRGARRFDMGVAPS